MPGILYEHREQGCHRQGGRPIHGRHKRADYLAFSNTHGVETGTGGDGQGSRFR